MGYCIYKNCWKFSGVAYIAEIIVHSTLEWLVAILESWQFWCCWYSTDISIYTFDLNAYAMELEFFTWLQDVDIWQPQDHVHTSCLWNTVLLCFWIMCLIYPNIRQPCIQDDSSSKYYIFVTAFTQNIFNDFVSNRIQAIQACSVYIEVGLSIFSLVNLYLFYWLERIHTLTWECICSWFWIRVAFISIYSLL
jgi:hypothetical protein